MRAIRDYERGLAPPELAGLRAALLRLVAERHPRLWGVALEALTQEAAPGTGASLAALLASAPEADDYRRQLLLALLRLRHREALGAAHGVRLGRPARRPPRRPHRARGHRPGGRHGGARSRRRLLRRGARRAAAPEGVEGYIPAFASTFLAEDDALLPLLVARTRARDSGAGAALAALLDAYLTRPWVVTGLGAPRADSVRRAVARAADGA